MEEIKFRTLNELYQRLYPAFNTKKNEITSTVPDIKEIDLWNYLKENIWCKNKKLNIYDMVNDIFNIDVNDLKKYLDKRR